MVKYEDIKILIDPKPNWEWLQHSRPVFSARNNNLYNDAYFAYKFLPHRSKILEYIEDNDLKCIDINYLSLIFGFHIKTMHSFLIGYHVFEKEERVYLINNLSREVIGEHGFDSRELFGRRDFVAVSEIKPIRVNGKKAGLRATHGGKFCS